MSTEPSDVKEAVLNGSEEPHGAEDGEAGDHPRVRRKRLGVDPSLILSDGRSKRRKTPDATPETDVKKEQNAAERDPKDPERAAELGRQIYQKIIDTKDKDGEQLADPFMKLPNKRSFPDYYETIKHPMCLETVDKKLSAKEYQTLKDVVADIGQIFNNAKRYNTKESLLFQWAKRLHKMTRTFYSNITSPGEAEPDSDHEDGGAADTSIQADVSMEVDDEPEGRGVSEAVDEESAAAKKKRGGYMREGPTTYKLIKPVLKAIKEAESLDGTNREIAGIFMELPDRKELPDYYKVITHPISLQEIEDRMMARKYDTWEEFFAEVELMCANAFAYNEDDSDVFKDAQQIKGILEQQRRHIHYRLDPSAHAAAAKPKVKPPSVTPSRGMPSVSAEPPSTSYAPVMPQQPGRQPMPAKPTQYLPALPKGVVTEEVVATLDRYPLYEQQAWASSLPPVSMQVYRQIQAGNEARRRIAEGQGVGAGSGASVPTPSAAHNQPLPQLAELPSAGRAGGSAVPRRPAPPLPAIRCIDFAFSSTPSQPMSAGQTKDRQAIRLHNMRGVVTHAVVVGSETSEIELTAYIADPPTRTTNGEMTPAHLEDVPEVSLRINGNQGNLPRFIFAGDQKDKPAGMRWVVSVPAARADTKIEIRATKPGALAETSSIYINRQM